MKNVLLYKNRGSDGELKEGVVTRSMGKLDSIELAFVPDHAKRGIYRP